MKKIICLIFVIALALVMSVTAFAADRYVYDDAGVLSDSEIASLEEKCREIHDKYNFDVVIVTTNKTNGDLQSFADDFYDYGGFLKDGVLYVYRESPRRAHISTAGKGIKDFYDSDIEILLDRTTPKIADGEYYSAFSDFIYETERLITGKGLSKSTQQILIYIAISIGIGLVVAGIVANGQKKKLTTAVKQRGAMNYISPNSAKINVARDMFLYSTTTRIRRETETRSGGGSSHISSSGSSHGGGGRSF